MDGHIILGGDFNQTLDDYIDRSKTRTGATPKDRQTLHILQEELGLTDVWRLVNPKQPEYTFYSHSQK